mgnify:CR=1 FL=1
MNNRYFFASANTNLGFINFFDNILDKDKKGFTYIIKGSSGCGKSTLLKKVANYFISCISNEIQLFLLSMYIYTYNPTSLQPERNDNYAVNGRNQFMQDTRLKSYV